MSYSYGGGFMADSPSASQSSPGKQKPIQQSLRPVVLRQIVQASQSHLESEIIIDDSGVSQVTFVAQVLSTQNQNTSLVVKLDDGTAQMEGRQWMQTRDDIDPEKVGEDQGLVDNRWVRIIGTIKTFGGKRQINILVCRPVTDFHEVYFALLEALQAHLYFTRGHPDGRSTATTKPADASAYTSGTTAVAQDSAFSQLKGMERKIVDFIAQNAKSEEGVHVTAITRALGQVNAVEVSNALERLGEAGHIYNTLDELHFNLSV